MHQKTQFLMCGTLLFCVCLCVFATIHTRIEKKWFPFVLKFLHLIFFLIKSFFKNLFVLPVFVVNFRCFVGFFAIFFFFFLVLRKCTKCHNFIMCLALTYKICRNFGISTLLYTIYGEANS